MRDSLGAVQSVLVLGATSDIARATARALARGLADRFLLAARHPDSVGVEELRSAGASQVDRIRFDAHDLQSHEAVVDDAFARLGDVDLALLAFGELGDGAGQPWDREGALSVAATNYTGAV